MSNLMMSRNRGRYGAPKFTAPRASSDARLMWNMIGTFFVPYFRVHMMKFEAVIEILHH